MLDLYRLMTMISHRIYQGNLWQVHLQKKRKQKKMQADLQALHKFELVKDVNPPLTQKKKF